MTHLPIVGFKTMEKVLLNLGFQNTCRKGSHFSIVILMIEQPLSLITREEIYHVLFYVKFFGKSNLLLASLQRN